jgi:hypothetical protein
MTFDMNDAEPQKTSDLIPDGSFAKITMTIRPGNADGHSEIDQGLLKASNSPGSDVLMLDAEFTVVEGPLAKRKFWQMFTVSGGKLDENGVSIGWKISKSTFRAMIDSALGLSPDDMSEETKTKRVLRGLADLGGITCVAKIKIEPSSNPQYSDSNKIEKIILPNEVEWRKIMDGEAVPAAPSNRARQTPKAPASTAPAWSSNTASAPAATTAPFQQPGAQAAAEAQPAAQGPAWLNP